MNSLEKEWWVGKIKMVKRYPEAIKDLSRSFQIMIFTFVNRLDSGKNCLVALVGGTGSGKSFAGVSILYWVHIYMHGEPPSVDYMKDRWFFTGKNFMKRMNDEDLQKKEGNLWDEMGTSASHKTHQSLQNKAIGWLVQTFRNLEQLVIFTVPTLNFVDKTVRNLLHFQLETRTIMKGAKVCIIKPLELQYNIRMDKMFYHNLGWPSNDGSGLIDIVDVIGIPIPPKDFVKAYEEKSWGFKKELNIKIQKMLERSDEKEKFDNLMGEDLILHKCTDRQKEIWELLKEGTTSTNKISEIIGIPAGTISTNFGYMRRKGLNVDKFLKKTEISSIKLGNDTKTT